MSAPSTIQLTNNIYNTSDLVSYYHDQNLNGQIKIYFRKSDIKQHNSKIDKPFYIVKPLVVKVGDEFDNKVNYSIFIKPKYNYRLNIINNDMWLMIIDDDQKTFENNEGKEISFYDVSLKFVTNQKLINMILEKYLNSKNINEFNDDEL